jgi:hypothetical protein
LQHREGIYWCPAPVRDEDRRNYKVRDVADVQAAPPPPVDEYISESMVGRDDEAPATSHRMPSKVVAPRRMLQTSGKMSASRAAATIAATQTMEAKKKRKRTGLTVLVDTTTVSSGVETIDVDNEEGDVESPSATATPSAGTPLKAASLEKQAVGTPRQTSSTQECPRWSTDTMGDLGSHKRARKAPPKPDLRSATK